MSTYIARELVSTRGDSGRASGLAAAAAADAAATPASVMLLLGAGEARGDGCRMSVPVWSSRLRRAASDLALACVSEWLSPYSLRRMLCAWLSAFSAST